MESEQVVAASPSLEDPPANIRADMPNSHDDDSDSDYDIDEDDDPQGDSDDDDDEDDDDDSDDSQENGAAGAAAAPALGKRARRRGAAEGARPRATSGAAAAPDDDDDDSDSDDSGDNDGDDDAQDEAEAGEVREPPADYLDDGTEEEDEEEEEEEGEQGGVRRPQSIQEFLAWRLLWRLPRGSESARNRYPLYEDAIPAALTRGSLWQQISQATGAALPSARNRAPPFNSPLDAGFDCAMFASRDAPYGLKVRQSVQEAVARDPRVAARVTLLGPQPPPAAAAATASSPLPGTSPLPNNPSASASASAATPAAAAAAAAAAASPSASSRGGFFGLFGSVAPPPPPPAPQSSPPQRSQPRHHTAHPHTAAAAAADSDSLLPPCGYLTGLPCPPSPRLLMRREAGGAGGRCGALSGAQMRHLNCRSALPRYPRAVVDRLASRAYIGQFSADGQFFVAAFQDRRVRLYDVERGWRLRKDITTRMCRWTITDTCISPDQRFVIYSSIIPVVHLVEVGSVYDSVSSICNITQIHEPLNFDSNTGGFGIWSVKWSGDGREIVVGNNDSSVVVMDVETKRVVASAAGHEDDVNAVAYADASPHIILSGSDDTFIKVWDRRTMPGPPPPSESPSSSRRRPIPAGVFVGHTEGLTHLHSRGDGRHVLSNAKDQTAKLWDLRMMGAGGSLRDAPSAARLSGDHVPQFNWDYRWQEYPAGGRVVRHPYDSSLQTFRGHTVQNTLIRAYFSPAHSTGQRFVYTGSADGAVHVYDVVSGQEVEGSPLRLHHKLVRDVSWHPYDPVLATVSWDGTVVRWDAVPPTHGSRALQVPGHDALNDDY